MKKRKVINFAVGPVHSHKDVLALGSDDAPYFVTPEYRNLMQENETLFKEYLNAPDNSKVAFITASGSGAMDATVVSLLTAKDCVLIVNGGTFGERFKRICDVYKIRYENLVLKPGEALTEKHLEPYEKNEFTGLLVNMHETSTGLLYDMDLISRFTKKHNLLLIIDAISAFVSDELDMKKLGADAVIVSSQKGLALPPGISMVAFSKKAIDLIMKNDIPSFYFNLQIYLQDGVRRYMPFTPAVTTMHQLNLRLRKFANGNFAKEQENIKAHALMFREKIKNYPFEIFSETPAYCLTPLKVKKSGLTGEKVINILREQYNIVLAASIGDLKEVMFRVGHIGDLKKKDYVSLFKAFDDMLDKELI